MESLALESHAYAKAFGKAKNSIKCYHRNCMDFWCVRYSLFQFLNSTMFESVSKLTGSIFKF